MARTAGRGAKEPLTTKSAPDRVFDVTVVLLEGGYTSTAIAPIEVFHSAGLLWEALHGGKPEPRFRVRAASLDGGGVQSVGALNLMPEANIGEIAHTDIIVIPTTGLDMRGGIARHPDLLPWLRHWHRRGAHVAGICTGVAYLAESGLLDGRRATTHWAVADELREKYPRVKWRPELFVTEDQRVLCSGGVYAAVDLSLYLVEKFCGHEVALQCAKSLLVSMPRARQSGYAVLPLSRPHGDDRIRAAEEYLQEHFRGNVSINTLAAEVCMAPRTFIRRFKAATGRLPGAYVQHLRVAVAKGLLERGTMPIQGIAASVGYEDIAFFRRLFKRQTGMTPIEYRENFGGLGILQDVAR